MRPRFLTAATILLGSRWQPPPRPSSGTGRRPCSSRLPSSASRNSGRPALRRRRPGRPSRRRWTPARRPEGEWSIFRPANTLPDHPSRSHVRFFIEAGATLFASRDKQDYDKEALFYGEDLGQYHDRGTGPGGGPVRVRVASQRYRRPLHPRQPVADGGGRKAAPAVLSPSRTHSPRWSFSCAARTSGSAASASCTLRAGRSTPTAANAWSSTASISPAAGKKGSGPTALTRTAARI